METIQGITYESQTVTIDGKSLVDCILNNCTIVYSGGDYSWVNTKAINCKVSFTGPAGRVYNFAKSFGIIKDEKKPKKKA